MNKRTKKILLLGLLVSILCMNTSCVTSTMQVPVPGSKNSRIKNIYNEYMNIADAYYSLENFDQAVNYYKLAMNSKSLYWGAYYKLAKCYALKNNYDEALEMYNIILKKDPDNPSLRSSIAYLYVMKGDIKKAKTIYIELIESHPEIQDILENYIAILFKEEEFESAKEQLEILKTQFPDSKNIKVFESEVMKIEEQNKKDEGEALEGETSDSSESQDSVKDTLNE